MLGAIWLISLYLLEDAVIPGQTFEGRAVVGFGIGLVCGLVTCWLRTAIDLMLVARSHALAAEHERLQVNLAYKYQRRLNELKDGFLLNVSHELRTPLTVLAGSLDLLEEHAEQLDASARADLLGMARESHEELAYLVDQFLDATHVMSEIAEVQLEEICLHTLVQKELTALSQKAPLPYTIHVRVLEKIMVRVDPKLLHHVLRNLLSNIVKYVPPQTEVTIAATQADPSSPACLKVQDAGPGIPTQERALLFEKFVRLKRDMAGTTRGTGLGLYISKRLVEAMGGQIWVESSGQPGEGSCFYLTLPAGSP
jgi:signal transduction histidine kinase